MGIYQRLFNIKPGQIPTKPGGKTCLILDFSRASQSWLCWCYPS
jgi:hypothetical protein